LNVATFSRAEALAIIAEEFPTEPAIITLGATVRELIATVGRRENDLYVLDSMGLPVAIGLGIALGRPDNPEKVVVIEGDGGLLMGFSSLATVGFLKPRNLVILILDNGTYASTGGQPTAATTTDFVAVAQGCGIHGIHAEDEAGFRTALMRAREQDGPTLVRMMIDQRSIRTPYLLEDPVLLSAPFRARIRG
jgi:thiamine pyrophosphate-dependent acetolactate synthase large subunit-like protein